jgi:hypothetical protein
LIFYGGKNPLDTISHFIYNIFVMDTIIRDADFEKVADSVKPDAKRRVVLQKVQIEEGVSYRIYRNRIGQILLDPQVTIPASEAWLFNNPKALASVRRGLSDAANGKISRVDLKSL